MNKKIHPFDQQDSARGDTARLRILEALRQGGAAPRANLGRMTGLSPAWVTAITRDLMAEDILVEAEDDPLAPAARPGRPGIRLDFNAGKGAAIGLWVGLNRIALSLTDYSGIILSGRAEQIELTTVSADGLLDQIAARIAAFIAEEATGYSLVGLGISFQGFVDQIARTIIWSPVTAFRDLAIAEGLEARVGLPVVLDNDASAMAYAICRRDLALQSGLTACIMIGDGVGLGLLRDRQLMRGARGGGNEFGHVRLDPGGPQCRCGARGCIEAYLADYAIYRDAMSLGDLPAPATGRQPSEVEMQMLVDRADQGDRPIRTLLERGGTPLAAGVTTLIHLFQPDHVVFCGPGVRSRHYLEPFFLAELERQVIPELRRATRFSVAEYTPSLLTDGIVLQVLEAADRRLARRAV